MKRSVNPLLIVGLVFFLMGVMFAVLGGVFISVSGDDVVLLSDPDVWLFEHHNDEVALPMVGVVFAVLGGIFLAVGGVLLFLDRRSARRLRELQEYGERVPGTVTDITLDRTVSVNGNHPLIVHVTCRSPRGGDVTVKSRRIWNTTLSTGDSVDVLFDPMDERRYAVDLQDSTTE